jgi:hypothetical protein
MLSGKPVQTEKYAGDCTDLSLVLSEGVQTPIAGMLLSLTPNVKEVDLCDWWTELSRYGCPLWPLFGVDMYEGQSGVSKTILGKWTHYHW